MRVLADESVPRRFVRLLVGHDVQTVQQAGWTSLSNGTLLHAAAEAGFQAFVTVDQNMPFQQNVSKLALGIIILVAKSSRFSDLNPLAERTLAEIANIRPATVVRVVA